MYVGGIMYIPMYVKTTINLCTQIYRREETTAMPSHQNNQNQSRQHTDFSKQKTAQLCLHTIPHNGKNGDSLLICTVHCACVHTIYIHAYTVLRGLLNPFAGIEEVCPTFAAAGHESAQSTNSLLNRTV